jgi:heptosyltransferase-2
VSPAPIDPVRVRRVLVRLPNWLGDTVMAVPAVRALRAAVPAAEVWCAGPWAEAVLEVPGDCAHRVATPPALGPRLAQARRWRALALDLALVLPNSLESGLAAWLGRARWRIGYAAEGRGALLTHALPAPAGVRHQVAAYLELLRPLLGSAPPVVPPSVACAPAARLEARGLLAGTGVAAGEGVVGLQLGAAFGPSKLWPPARLAALAARLEARGLRAVFLGAAEAAPLLEAVAAAAGGPVRSLVGRDRPALLPALLAELDALVAADSGPAHLAAAVGCPTVTLFGPTDPRLTAPLGPRQRAIWRRPPCAPCFIARCPIDHRCLREVEPEAVEAEVMAVLEARP